MQLRCNVQGLQIRCKLHTQGHRKDGGYFVKITKKYKRNITILR